MLAYKMFILANQFVDSSIFKAAGKVKNSALRFAYVVISDFSL